MKLFVFLFVALIPYSSAIAAQDIVIKRAEVFQGSISLRGIAPAFASTPVIWEGMEIGKTNSKGRFRITTTKLPRNCVGALEIGNTKRPVVLKNCGPKGDDGEPGTPSKFVVKIDKNCALTQREICENRPPKNFKIPVFPDLTTSTISLCDSDSGVSQNVAIAYCM